LHRQGQEKPVIINHLVSKGTIDEQVMRALRSKAAGQDALMEAVKAEIRKAKLHDAKTQNQDRHQP
jgi:SNF2 family DNA or RNA helicase